MSGDCFASVAIRSCFSDTLLEFRCILRSSQVRFVHPTRSFPPLGPARLTVPQLHWYYQRAPTPVIHPTSLRFLRSAVPTVYCFSLHSAAINAEQPGLSWYGRPPILSVGNNRSSQVPVQPPYLFAHVPSTPVGSLVAHHIASKDSVPTNSRMKTPAISISKLNSMAFRLAVYAS